MKTLYCVRHAKSSWSDPDLADYDRPLNGRGKRDAPFMADMSVMRESKPDIILSSPAKRALVTANTFRKAHGLKKSELIRDERLYLASPDIMLDVVREMPSEFNVIYMFGHNPGMTYLANYFTDDRIDNVPTCGMFKIVGEFEHWHELSDSQARLETFVYPKMFQHH